MKCLLLIAVAAAAKTERREGGDLQEESLYAAAEQQATAGLPFIRSDFPPNGVRTRACFTSNTNVLMSLTEVRARCRILMVVEIDTQISQDTLGNRGNP